MKKIDNITFNPRMRLIYRTTEYPNGDKVETIKTKDLGTFVKVTKEGKTETHQVPNDVYEKSEKLAQIFSKGDEEC